MKNLVKNRVKQVFSFAMGQQTGSRRAERERFAGTPYLEPFAGYFLLFPSFGMQLLEYRKWRKLRGWQVLLLLSS